MIVLWYFLFLLILSLPCFHGTKYQSDESLDAFYCDLIPKTDNNIWVRTEITPAGLANQLFGVVNFIPFAMLINSSAIIGDMYSRNSFNDVWPIEPSDWKRLPFSWFFHWDYFHQFWKAKGIETIERYEYDRCLTNTSEIPLVRTQGFFPMKRVNLIKMIKQSNIPYPIPANTTIKLIANFGFITLMNHWENPKVLYEVYKSLQPTTLIRQYVDIIQKELPKDYLAIHLRLEGDMFDYDNITELSIQVDQATKHILTHKCLKSFLQINSSSNNHQDIQPTIYLATGIFSDSPSHRNKKQVHMGSSKVYSKLGYNARHLVIQEIDRLFNSLQSVGLDKVENRISILNKLKYVYQSASARNISNPIQFPKLLPEQNAYVDYLISKKSHCFIDAHVSSSYSYFIERSRYLDKGILHGVRDITEKNYGISRNFGTWGL